MKQNKSIAGHYAGKILGTMVNVAIDRTYYSRRKQRGAYYVNCGYVRDNPEQEVFVIGEKSPLVEFSGTVIALAKTKGRQKVYYIVCRRGNVFYEPQIAAMLAHFLPGDGDKGVQYACLHEKSCGAVLYTDEGQERKFLLIKNISGHIGFPKGHVEFGENEKQTALREIYEETGIHAQLIDGFRDSYWYFINNYVRKKAVYFLAEFDPADIQMQIREISEYLLVNYEQALHCLNFQHDKNVLRSAEEFIGTLYGQSLPPSR